MKVRSWFASNSVCTSCVLVQKHVYPLWKVPSRLHSMLTCKLLHCPGIDVNLLTGPPVASNWLGAKSCFHRSPYSTEVAPPVGNMEEAYRRYGMPRPPHEPVNTIHPPPSMTGSSSMSCANQTSQALSFTSQSDSSSTPSISSLTESHNSTSSSIEVPSGLEEVRYEVLLEATRQFDKTPYKEGGHKVGEGGFGEVFQCSLLLQKGRVHAAVKVLLNQVCSPVASWLCHVVVM